MDWDLGDQGFEIRIWRLRVRMIRIIPKYEEGGRLFYSGYLLRERLTTRGPVTRSSIGAKRISNSQLKEDVERERHK